MAVLMALSAFFSASEAALFLLTRDDRQRLALGTTPQRVAHKLLSSPERLLTAILFWNLVINIVYFALASMVGLKLERAGMTSESRTLAVVALLAIILCSEMLPKNIAVLWPQKLSGLVSIPLAAATRLVDPLIPTLQVVNKISLRAVAPKFEREAQLELRDLERAITISTPDKSFAEREAAALQQIVSLSELEAEELMQPRLAQTTFHPPVSLEELQANPPQNGYLLVTEPDSDEIDRVLHLKYLADAPTTNIEQFCEPVQYIPWCTPGSAILDLLSQTRDGLATVVNEHGETVGVVTLDDIMHVVYGSTVTRESSRSASLTIEDVEPGLWRLSGAITLRRFAKHLAIPLPEIKSVTIAGMLQELLQRVPQEGDHVDWAGCHFSVIESSRPGIVRVEVDRLGDRGESSPGGADV